MSTRNPNSFQSEKTLEINKQNYHYFSLPEAAKSAGVSLDRLPYSLKILLENLLRNEDGSVVKKEDLLSVMKWESKAEPSIEIQFTPARTILQDFTGVPAVADLAAMRGALKKLGGDPKRINPLEPADLVIDHSVQVDFFGTSDAAKKNADLEFKRNQERYEFLKWGQNSFQNFRVVPPETGIVHQVNLETLAQVVMKKSKDGKTYLYPDTLVGTDSHTTMINGLGVLGWGVGGIEAEAAMLGQPSTMLIPQVVGFRLKGKLPAGSTATDLVLTVTQMLRKKGVVGKFVEFFGDGMSELSLANRATIANMAPEYGATCGIFPVDEETLRFLELTGRSEAVPLVREYCKAQGLYYQKGQKDAEFTDILELDLSTVEPSLAGPARPQDRVTLSEVSTSFKKACETYYPKQADALKKSAAVKDPNGNQYQLEQGAVSIAAITSCTNTSNPYVMVAAGLLAKKAIEAGLKAKPWVKTSLAPGSKVVTDYLESSGLSSSLDALGFQTVGYGCTTCIGNSGPLPPHIEKAVKDEDLAVASVLSGNRNFEGRVNNFVRSNYLASPPLVVAYALAGNVTMDLQKDPLGKGKSGNDVYLKDIWPTHAEVDSIVQKFITSEQFKKSYSDVFKGPKSWQEINAPQGELYSWDSKSTYIQEPPYFLNLTKEVQPKEDIKQAKVLLLLGDSVTTDHISPAGSFSKETPAGIYLLSLGVQPEDFNSYGSRRGNHEVMMRGTFANVRIKNKLLSGVEGGFTKYIPTGDQMTVFDASMKYQKENIPLIVIAGKEYGTGSSRDWAAKGPKLLGVKAVIAQSFERIHRSNLIGMGILPLQFIQNQDASSLGLDGTESFDILDLQKLAPGCKVKVHVTKSDQSKSSFDALCRIDTPNELEYYKNDGILSYVLRQIASEK